MLLLSFASSVRDSVISQACLISTIILTKSLDGSLAI